MAHEAKARHRCLQNMTSRYMPVQDVQRIKVLTANAALERQLSIGNLQVLTTPQRHRILRRKRFG